MNFRKLAALFMALMLVFTVSGVNVSGESAPVLRIPESIEVHKGAKAAKIEAVFEPDGYSETITWTSSDKSVATVNKKGKVKGVGDGQCVITAVTPTGLTAQCAVTVVRGVKSVSLDRKSLELGLGRSAGLSAAVKPKKAHDKSVVWKSSDTDVVTVDENGVVTAVGKGKATVTVTTVCGGFSAKCAVTVKNIKPTSIKTKDMFITLNPGKTHVIDAKVKPAGASDTGIIFTSSDENVAAVDENGCVTALSAGRAVITMKASGKKSVKETVQVCVVEKGAGRMAGLVIGINPGHQTTTIKKKYPIAPGSKEKAYGCKIGAVGAYTRVPEYETNLQISLMLKELLEAEGATVVMTRTTNDVSINNIKRAKMLNKAKVDVALQVHCNSWTNPSKNGLSVYRKTTGDWQREELAIARLLTEGMEKTTGALNLGVKINDRYMSLNWSTTPAVLLEVGYLSNKREDKLLATDAYRLKVAEGIYEGLAEYFGR